MVAQKVKNFKTFHLRSFEETHDGNLFDFKESKTNKVTKMVFPLNQINI